MEFFTADYHLGHANIIGYCDRPFPDVETMDATIITNHNAAIGDDDTVTILGDLCFTRGRPKHAAAYISQLQGIKQLARGNHDLWQSNAEWIGCGFADAFNQRVISIDGLRVLLNHWPIAPAKFPPAVDMVLCGHVHGRTVPPLNCCVSVEHWDYTPVSREALIPLLHTIYRKDA
jgi:calcineurin-like phosphoesterase family protein